VRRNTFSDVPFRLSVLETIYGEHDGIHVMHEDWDNLIILDACRHDIFKQVNNLDGNLSSKKSRGTATAQFLRRNFVGHQAYDTLYVTDNAVVGTVSESLNLFKLVGLWGDTEAGTDVGDGVVQRLINPELVVDKTIEMHERYPNKRIIAHLLPPHQPYLVKDGEKLNIDSIYTTFEAARKGNLSAEDIKAVYAENVKHSLKYVSKLVMNLDGKTVVTSDHGELLGKKIPRFAALLHPRWPFSKRHYFRYGHYRYMPEPELVEIPWLEIEGERRTVRADDPIQSELDFDEQSIEQQLEMLGYK
jgi:hypothetical protein